MTAPMMCPICKGVLHGDDEIACPTFWEGGQEVQYLTHAQCFDLIRGRLQAAMASWS